MAEKKFFVDINLQGSALTNATIGTNSSLTKAGSFGFDGTRLKYFDGTAIKDVANLSDISAVTGGLIFQGGYDPTTDTPDITDGSALKGFFWAATAAGTFLGESVQVGDSIVAKVDNAGATIADWLILQGNIVIATDSVDGISRLATQTEANDGTEGGAVVITPATLQGKIDAQITPEISSKLPLSGGTMSGNIDMDGNNINTVQVLNVRELGSDYPVITLITPLNADGQIISDLPAPTSGGDAANKTYVDNNTSNKLPLAGGTMTGAINMNNHYIDGVSNINANIVNANFLDSNTGDPIVVSANLDFSINDKIVNLPAPTDGGDATNKTYVDDQDALKVSKSGDTMSGNLDMGGYDVNGANVVNSNYFGSSTNSVITFNNNLDFNSDTFLINLPAPVNGGDATNKTYVDDNTSNKLPLAGGTMSGNIDMGGVNSITNVDIVNTTTIANLANNGGFNFDNNTIELGGTIDTITNLAAPTNGTDATNKTYVDGVGATAQANAEATASADATAKADAAESNANDYTDTEIAAQSYVANIEVVDWTLESGSYYFDAAHGFGLDFSRLIMMAFYYATDEYVELSYARNGSNTRVFTNILPVDRMSVSFVKAQ